MKEVYLILDNIRSTYNVGSIFRTADAVGVKQIFLVGVTPAPIDRFGREQYDIAKVALGAEKSIGWEQREDLLELIGELKEQNIEIVALEQSENSIDYKDFEIDGPTALILGEETQGISSEILEKVDKAIEIPMRGEKESLNVAVAAGVALARITNL